MSASDLISQIAISAVSTVIAGRSRRELDANSEFDPVRWCREQVKLDPWAKQEDILRLPFHHRRAAVRSGHGVGKTTIAAATALAFFKAYPDSIVITTAPTERQVKDQLWGYIRDFWKRSAIGGKLLTTKLTVTDRHYMAGYTARNAESFQGIHAPHLLIIVDEASGIEPHIERAIEGLMSSGDAHLLLIGNPTRRSGLFFEAFHEKRSLYHGMHISCFDSPNITDPVHWPNLTGMQFIEEKQIELGVESPLYQIQVLGDFPDSEADGVIPITWVETSAQNTFDDDGPFVAGLDVARYGGDENVLILRRGRQMIGIWSWYNLDLMQTASHATDIIESELARIAREEGEPRGYPLSAIFVDSIGMGQGVADRMRDLNMPVEDFIGGAKAEQPDMLNLRAEAYWYIRELFRDSQIGGVKDTKLQSQLTSVLYRTRGDRRIQIESKEEMRKRGLRSPDRADAFVMCYQKPSLRPQVRFI